MTRSTRVLDGAKLVTYGDSLTAFGTWPLTVAENTNMFLYNGATGGINSGRGLERFEAFVAAQRPDFVTLSFGMNDLLMCGKNEPQVDPVAFKANMKALCERVTALGAVPILLTVSYLNEEVFWTAQAQDKSHYTDVGTPLQWLDTYNANVRALAEEQGIDLVDIRKACDDYAVTEFLCPDGIHLGDKGNDVYAAAITDYLLTHFTVDPNAPRIASRFPCVASPAAPAVTSIVPHDPCAWSCAEDGAVCVTLDEEGALLMSNTNGRWPAADYDTAECVLVPLEGTSLVYDFSTAQVNTSVILFFGGATPHAPTKGKFACINAMLGVPTNEGGDIVEQQHCRGVLPLSQIVKNSPTATDAVDVNGNVMLSGVRFFVAGTAGQPITVRELAFATVGVPNK